MDASCPHATLTLVSTILSRRQLNSSPNPPPNAIQTQLFYALEQKEKEMTSLRNEMEVVKRDTNTNSNFSSNQRNRDDMIGNDSGEGKGQLTQSQIN